MLSVTTATVHRSMCPSTPNNSSSQRPERSGSQSWNCDYNVITKTRRRLGATKKSPTTFRSINAVDVKNKNDIFDELKSQKKVKFEPIDHPNKKHTETSNIGTDNKYLNPFYKKGPLNSLECNNESLEIDEITSEDDIFDENDSTKGINNSLNIKSEKRKRDDKSQMSQSAKLMKTSEICKIEPVPINNDEKYFFQELEEEAMKKADFDDVDQVTSGDWNDWENDHSRAENPFDTNNSRSENPFDTNSRDENPFDTNSRDENPFDTNSRAENPYDEDLFHPDTPYYMVGFPNPPGENRCWLNATLHALFALPLIDKLDRLDLDGCSRLTKTLIAMQLFWREGPIEKDKTYQTVTKFKDQLGILDSSYPSERQQDVSEFLMIFLNYVKTDCDNLISSLENSAINKCPEKTMNENSRNTSPYSRSPVRSSRTPNKRSPLTPISPFKRRINFNENSDRQNEESTSETKIICSPMTKISDQINALDLIQRNPIDEFFSLRMMEHYVCQECSNHRQRKVDNLMLYVDLPENEMETIDLSQSIKKSMEIEERTLSCGKCKGKKHDVFTSFRRSPNVLIVQIKRYGMTSDGFVAKINTSVHIPDSLTLESSEFTNDCIEGEIFVPICMIAHVGAAMDCGHYTSYVKHADQWFHYNDLNVVPMSSSEAFSAAESTAYVVFFVNAKLLTETSSYKESEETLR